MRHDDMCPVCELGQLKLMTSSETLTGEFGSALKGKISVPYTFEAHWLVCSYCGEEFLTSKDAVQWCRMSEELKSEFEKRNEPLI